MKKSLVLGLHFGFWMCHVLITLAFIGLYTRGGQGSVSFQDGLIRGIPFAILPSIVSYYGFYFLVFPRVRARRILLAVLYALGISVGSALMGTALTGLFLGLESVTEAEESAAVGIAFVSAVAFVVGMVALVSRGFLAWFEEVKLKEELKQKNHEMEMALIKSQLDPHFLFNTLNNIDILILKDAAEASKYLNKLSDIMRFLLFETRTEEILLAAEIEYIEKYIALQRIRTANANYINFRVTGHPAGQTIAPMIFLPFIENAFKHTSNKKLDKAIDIHILIEKGGVQLTCKNKFNPKRKLTQKYNGLGNELIKRRLHLMYPDRHRLEVKSEQEQYSVCLSIQQQA
ncbi:MAG: sensor histidine kinase [Bacteroidota bacterium]